MEQKHGSEGNKMRFDDLPQNKQAEFVERMNAPNKAIFRTKYDPLVKEFFSDNRKNVYNLLCHFDERLEKVYKKKPDANAGRIMSRVLFPGHFGSNNLPGEEDLALLVSMFESLLLTLQIVKSDNGKSKLQKPANDDLLLLFEHSKN